MKVIQTWVFRRCTLPDFTVQDSITVLDATWDDSMDTYFHPYRHNTENSCMCLGMGPHTLDTAYLYRYTIVE